MGFHDAAVAIPDSPPVRFEQAYVVFDHGHARLTPAVVRTAEQDQAQIEADYALDGNTLDLSIHTESMRVASLRAQVALAAVPWLEQIQDGAVERRSALPPEAAQAGLDRPAGDPRCADRGAGDCRAGASSRRRGRKSTAPAWCSTRSTPQAGKVAFTGEYRYEPAIGAAASGPVAGGGAGCGRPGSGPDADFRRDRSLIARALGRTSVPDWLKEREVEGTIQIDDLLSADCASPTSGDNCGGT